LARSLESQREKRAGTLLRKGGGKAHDRNETPTAASGQEFNTGTWERRREDSGERAREQKKVGKGRSAAGRPKQGRGEGDPGIESIVNPK